MYKDLTNDIRDSNFNFVCLRIYPKMFSTTILDKIHFKNNMTYGYQYHIYPNLSIYNCLIISSVIIQSKGVSISIDVNSSIKYFFFFVNLLKPFSFNSFIFII